MAAAIITIPTPSSAAATASCRSISMFPAVRRRRRLCCTAFCSCRRRSAGPAPSPAENESVMTEGLQQLGEHVTGQNPGLVAKSEMIHGELILWTKSDSLLQLLRFLRDDPRCRFRTLVDICGVDYPERPQRFEVVYNLLSIHNNHRIRVKLPADEATAVPSATGLYSAAGWFEREAWDLFGIYFADHADLRRLLTDYGF